MPSTRQYYKCPECGEKIDYLNYTSTVYEDGNYDISNEDWNCENSETQDTNYECPECNCSVDNHDLAEWVEEEQEEEIVPARNIEETPGAETVARFNVVFEQRGMYSELNSEGVQDTLLRNSHICPKCSYFFPKMSSRPDYEENKKEDIECPECGYAFDPAKFLKARESKIKRNKTIIKVVRIRKRKKNANSK